MGDLCPRPAEPGLRTDALARAVAEVGSGQRGERVEFRDLRGATLANSRALVDELADDSRPSGRVIALGKYSYGLYVYHHFLSYYAVRHGTEFDLARVVGSHTLAVWIQAAAGIAVSLAVAWASYEMFERRFLDLKRYWPSPAEAEAKRTLTQGPSRRAADCP